MRNEPYKSRKKGLANSPDSLIDEIPVEIRHEMYHTATGDGRKKGQFKDGNPGRPQLSLTHKTRLFLNELMDIYHEIGGKEKYILHLKSNQTAYEKFIDKITRVACQLEEKDKTLTLQGQITHEHKFGFTPELVAEVVNQITAGVISENELLSLPMPESPEEDKAVLNQVVDADFKEVEP